MSTPDRDDRLRRVERARQAGRLDLAIAELEGLVAQYPEDVGLANTLGDLHVSLGRPAPALPLYLRVGDHFFREGFFSKATAVYRKILKFVPRDESMILRLAEALAAQGLTVEARGQFAAVETARRHRGDVRGAEDVALRVSDLEPGDLAARWSAARALALRGDPAAVARYESLAADLERQERLDEALAVWHEVISLVPADVERRLRVARLVWARGDATSARIFLAVDDMPPHGPALALLTEIELRTGTADGIRSAAARWLEFDRDALPRIVQAATGIAIADPERGWACLSVALERALGAGRSSEAEHILRTFVSTGVLHGPALVKWVEVAVLAHLDGVVGLVRECLTRLPPPDASPVSARAVIAAAAGRVVPHGPWRPLFDEYLERSATATAQDSAPGVGTDQADAARAAARAQAEGARPGAEAASIEPARAAVDPPEAWPAAERVTSVPQATAPPPADDGVKTGPREFIEIDLTDALNAIAVPDVQDVASDRGAEPEAPLVAAAGGDVSSAPAHAIDAASALAQGQTYLAAGMLDEARRSLTRALAGTETAVEAALALADLHDGAGQAGEACRVLEGVLPLASGRARGHVLAQLVVSLEHHGEAAQALRRLAELAQAMPHHPIVRARRGREEPPGR